MATSGTVDLTTIDAATVIEHAVRKCGVLVSVLAGEQLNDARENLFMLLTGLTNRGLNLWCIKKHLVSAVPGLEVYQLARGIVDVHRANFRYGTYTAATSYAGAIAALDYVTATSVVSVVLTAPVAGSYALVLESSPDGVTWTARGSASYPSAALGDLMGVDSESALAQRFWRVRETALVVTVAAASFTSAATEVPMAKYNMDTYQTLPDKGFASTQVLQYWYDKQADRPRAWLWPVAAAVGPQFVLWTQTQIEDVGDLDNELQLPKRWLKATILELAAMEALELPASLQVPEGRHKVLVDLASSETLRAEDGERDGAPIMVNPRIGVYTA